MGGSGSGRPKDTASLIVDGLELDRELFKVSFRDYVPEAFEVLESGDAYAAGVRSGLYKPRFTPGWHLDAIAEHLQAVTDGYIRRLLINISPGTMKSVETCVLWPTWMWGRNAQLAAHRFIFSSYAEEFTKRDTRRSKALMQSEWYRALFPHVVLRESPDTMLEHHNTLGGERHGASTNSGVTGKHVHGVVEDDPIKTQDAQSERARNEAWFYHSQVLSSRLLPEAGWRVVVMQRLHEKDVSGMIMAHANGSDDDYVHLNLPMEFEPRRKCVVFLKHHTDAHKMGYGQKDPENGTFSTIPVSIDDQIASGAAVEPPAPFFEDPRTEENQLMWPERMNPKFIAEKKSPQGLGANGYAGQYQQRPAPAEGSIIKRDWLRYYKTLPVPVEQMTLEQSWDLIFDGDGVGSFVVGQVWAQHGANHYLIHQYRERVDFVKTILAFMNTTRAYPRAVKKKVEKKANGAALIAVLKNKVPGIVAVKPSTSKASRLESVSPLFEAGQVWVPEETSAPWVQAWVEEVVGMTSLGATTANDDQVDCASQYLEGKGVAVFQPFAIDLTVGAQANPWREFGAPVPRL